MRWLLLLLSLTASAGEKAQDALLLLDEGVKLYQRGDLEAARNVFRAARDLEPDKPNPHRWLGLADARLGRCGDAVQELEAFLLRVAADDPRVAEVKQVRDRCHQPRALPAAVETMIAGAPSLGPPDAPVVIVEFCDFETPFCASAEPTLRELRKQYGDRLQLVWKDHLLPFHQHARLTALAALAALDQHQFWPFHDKILAQPRALDRATLDGYARQLGLDLRRFAAAIDSPALSQQLEQEEAQLRALIPNPGAPEFLVNGRMLHGAQPIDVFRRAIDDLLRAQR